MTIHAAGVAFTAPGGEVLFLRRSAEGDHSGEWCLPGGKIENGETPEQAARREAIEETGGELFLEAGPIEDIATLISNEDVEFTTFRQPVVEPFAPTLNHEHTEFEWALPSQPPSPLHPGVTALLPRLAMDRAIDTSPRRIALDRASVRTVDRDGKLHVAISNISKANVCPYFGREIPDFDQLGLDPDRKYNLLRHPEELAKAASSFNNLQILSRHVPVNADDHQPDLVVGSTGTDGAFEAPFLRNSLVIWSRDAIDAIESEIQNELSSAYHYVADMTPGTFEGEQYDGVMRDIVGNHVALVKKGRAGSDVVVGDSAIRKIEEVFDMSKKVLLTRMGSVALGTLTLALRPILAQDASIDLSPLLVGLTSKNFKSKKPALVKGLKTVTKNKLAQDASIDDVIELVDSLEKTEILEGEDTDANSGLPVAMPDDTTMDAGAESVRALLAGKVDDDIIAKVVGLLGGGATAEDEDDEDETPEAKAARLAKEKDTKPAKDNAMKDLVKKPAMDQAIAAAVAQANKNQTAIREAERAVRPYVGELTMAFDSADQVYATALATLGFEGVDDIHPSAYPALLKTIQVPGSKPRVVSDNTLAMDAAAVTSFNTRFPGAAKIRQV